MYIYILHIYIYTRIYIYTISEWEPFAFQIYAHLLEGMLRLVRCEFSEVAVTPGLSQHHGAYGTEHLAAVRVMDGCLASVWRWELLEVCLFLYKYLEKSSPLNSDHEFFLLAYILIHFANPSDLVASYNELGEWVHLQSHVTAYLQYYLAT